MSFFDGKSVLVTGGTGSFGKEFIQTLLKEHQPAKIIIYSRDELKQHEMRGAGFGSPFLRYFIGDVCDRDRLKRALSDGYRYASNTNTEWLTINDLKKIISPLENAQIRA